MFNDKADKHVVVIHVPDIMCGGCTSTIDSALLEVCFPFIDFQPSDLESLLSACKQTSNHSACEELLQSIRRSKSETEDWQTFPILSKDAKLLREFLQRNNNEISNKLNLGKMIFEVKLNVHKKQYDVFCNKKLSKKAITRAVAEIGGFDSELKEPAWRARTKLLLSGGVGLALLILSMFSFGVPFFVWLAIASVSFLINLYSGYEIFYQGIVQAFKDRKINMVSLFSISIIVSFVTAVLAVFFPYLGFARNFSASLLLIAAKRSGDWLKKKMLNQFSALASFSQQLPAQVKVIDKTTLNKESVTDKFQRIKNQHIDPTAGEMCDCKDLQPGQVIIVPKGTMIPCDGIVMDKTAVVDDRGIRTGHKGIATSCKQGASVLAGMLAESDMLMMLERSSANSMVFVNERSAIDQSFKKNQEQDQKTVTVSLTERIAKIFTPAFFTLALVASVVIGLLTNPFSAIHLGVSLFVAACPCTFGFIDSLALRVLKKRLAKQKMYSRLSEDDLLPSLSFLKRKNKKWIFDVNGTLSEGKPSVTNSQPIDGTSQEDFERIIFNLETAIKAKNNRINPIGTALLERFTKKQNVQVENLQEIAGGFSADINGVDYYLGNESMLQKLGMNMPEENLHCIHRIFLVKKNPNDAFSLMGHVDLDDTLRPEAGELLKKLKKQNEEIILCSGASQAAIKRMLEPFKSSNDQAFINDENILADCHGALAKEERLNKKIAEQDWENTVVVGNDPNDSAMLGKAGFAVVVDAEKDNPVLQSAHLVIEPGGKLTGLLTVEKMLDDTNSLVKQSIGLSLFYNVSMPTTMIACFFAVSFMMHPALAAALMLVQVGLVLANAYRHSRKNITEMPTSQLSLCV